MLDCRWYNLPLLLCPTQLDLMRFLPGKVSRNFGQSVWRHWDYTSDLGSDRRAQSSTMLMRPTEKQGQLAKFNENNYDRRTRSEEPVSICNENCWLFSPNLTGIVYALETNQVKSAPQRRIVETQEGNLHIVDARPDHVNRQYNAVCASISLLTCSSSGVNEHARVDSSFLPFPPGRDGHCFSP